MMVTMILITVTTIPTMDKTIIVLTFRKISHRIHPLRKRVLRINRAKGEPLPYGNARNILYRTEKELAT